MKLDYAARRFAAFWNNVQPGDNGCWQWIGARTNSGYGKFSTDALLAHRYIYEQMVAPIPEGLEIDHLCVNKLCVNPYHMEPVTAAVNMHRRDVQYGIGSAATHCPQGHDYSPDNTAHRAGRRHCRACDRIRAQRNRDRSRQKVSA